MDTHAPLKFNLRHLYYFIILAEELHLGRAAERIGICESPLSKAITRLETCLSVQLFDRNRRRTLLTEAGTALLPEAKNLLSQLEHFVQSVNAFKAPIPKDSISERR